MMRNWMYLESIACMLMICKLSLIEYRIRKENKFYLAIMFYLRYDTAKR